MDDALGYAPNRLKGTEVSISTTGGEIPMVIKGLNHRFPQSNENFPSYPNAALQSERLINVATYCLCQAESVDFIYQPSNYNYLLRPKSPKRLLYSNEIPWGSLHLCWWGMSMRAVFHARWGGEGISLDVPNNRPAVCSEIEYSQIKTYRISGSNITEPTAPLWRMIRKGNSDYALILCLDELVNWGWALCYLSLQH